MPKFKVFGGDTISCLDNVNKAIIPTNMLLDMMKLYRFSGKDSYYNEIFSKDINAYRNVNIVEEVFYFAKIMELDITDERLKLLAKKDIVPKNNSEKIVNNLKNVFKLILYHVDQFDLFANEVQDLGNTLFNDVCKVKFVTEITKEKSAFQSTKIKKEYSIILQGLFDRFKSLYKSKDYEVSLLITSFFIDFVNYKVFEETNNYKINDYLGYLVLYILLFKYEFEVFNYKSFFKQVYENMKTFHTVIAQCSFNWNTGFSNPTLVHEFVVDRLLECYDLVEGEMFKTKHMRDNKFSKNLEIEITISHFPGDTFTKGDIQKMHPNVSAKTIERTLERLQSEGKIEALGTGRSAKWMKKFKLQSGFEYDTVQFNLGFEEEKK